MSSEAWKHNNQDKMRQYRREHYHRNAEHYKQMSTEYRESHKTKVCATCGIEKLAEEFKTKLHKGKRYLRYECRKCHNRRTSVKQQQAPGYPERINGKRRVSRLDPEQRSKWILTDAKMSDKRRGLKCDLDRDFIEQLISKGCMYCGSDVGMMTLDRVDNSIGHVRTNVNPSCFRCNHLRRDMPYQAWLIVAKGMKEAHALGLFGTWMSESFHKSRKNRGVG